MTPSDRESGAGEGLPEDKPASSSEPTARGTPDVATEAPAESERVGYKRPPRHSQFKKKQSGNPAGKRKGTKSFKTLLMQELQLEVFAVVNGKKQKMTKLEAGAKQFANRFASGDLKTLPQVLKLLADGGSEIEGAVEALLGSAGVTKEADDALVRHLEFLKTKAGGNDANE